MQSAQRPAADRMPTGRVTVREAAKLLGITVEAVRGRTKRGTLRSVKDEDGTVYVFLEDGEFSDQSDDQPGAGRQPDDDRTDDQTPLVDALQAHIEQLQRQLDEANRANSEHRRLLAAALERIPEIDPMRDEATEPQGDPVSPSEDRANGEPPEPERRSWWRRLLEM